MQWKIKDVIKIIEGFAPLESMAEYDNSGIICGDVEQSLTGVLITLDSNEDVVGDAIKNGCNLIIEHHPSIFYPIKRIDYRLPLHRAIVKAIKNDIVIYACHTNIDFARGGLNDYVAKCLGIKDIYYHKSDCSSARIGFLDTPIRLDDYAKRIKEILNDKHIMVIGQPDRQIKKVAVINGGGGGDPDLLLELDKDDVDVFMTGDIKYYTARFAKDYNYAIINFGHYQSEIYFLELVHNLLKGVMKNIKIIKTDKCLNPYN